MSDTPYRRLPDYDDGSEVKRAPRGNSRGGGRGRGSRLRGRVNQDNVIGGQGRTRRQKQSTMEALEKQNKALYDRVVAQQERVNRARATDTPAGKLRPAQPITPQQQRIEETPPMPLRGATPSLFDDDDAEREVGQPPENKQNFDEDATPMEDPAAQRQVLVEEEPVDYFRVPAGVPKQNIVGTNGDFPHLPRRPPNEPSVWSRISTSARKLAARAKRAFDRSPPGPPEQQEAYDTLQDMLRRPLRPEFKEGFRKAKAEWQPFVKSSRLIPTGLNTSSPENMTQAFIGQRRLTEGLMKQEFLEGPQTGQRALDLFRERSITLKLRLMEGVWYKRPEGGYGVYNYDQNPRTRKNIEALAKELDAVNGQPHEVNVFQMVDDAAVARGINVNALDAAVADDLMAEDFYSDEAKYVLDAASDLSQNFYERPPTASFGVESEAIWGENNKFQVDLWEGADAFELATFSEQKATEVCLKRVLKTPGVSKQELNELRDDAEANFFRRQLDSRELHSSPNDARGGGGGKDRGRGGGFQEDLDNMKNQYTQLADGPSAGGRNVKNEELELQTPVRQLQFEDEQMPKLEEQTPINVGGRGMPEAQRVKPESAGFRPRGQQQAKMEGGRVAVRPEAANAAAGEALGAAGMAAGMAGQGEIMIVLIVASMVESEVERAVGEEHMRDVERETEEMMQTAGEAQDVASQNVLAPENQWAHPDYSRGYAIEQRDEDLEKRLDSELSNNNIRPSVKGDRPIIGGGYIARRLARTSKTSMNKIIYDVNRKARTYDQKLAEQDVRFVPQDTVYVAPPITNLIQPHQLSDIIQAAIPSTYGKSKETYLSKFMRNILPNNTSHSGALPRVPWASTDQLKQWDKYSEYQPEYPKRFDNQAQLQSLRSALGKEHSLSGRVDFTPDEKVTTNFMQQEGFLRQRPDPRTGPNPWGAYRPHGQGLLDPAKDQPAYRPAPPSAVQQYHENNPTSTHMPMMGKYRSKRGDYGNIPILGSSAVSKDPMMSSTDKVTDVVHNVVYDKVADVNDQTVEEAIDTHARHDMRDPEERILEANEKGMAGVVNMHEGNSAEDRQNKRAVADATDASAESTVKTRRGRRSKLILALDALAGVVMPNAYDTNTGDYILQGREVREVQGNPATPQPWKEALTDYTLGHPDRKRFPMKNTKDWRALHKVFKSYVQGRLSRGDMIAQAIDSTPANSYRPFHKATAATPKFRGQRGSAAESKDRQRIKEATHQERRLKRILEEELDHKRNTNEKRRRKHPGDGDQHQFGVLHYGGVPGIQK